MAGSVLLAVMTATVTASTSTVAPQPAESITRPAPTVRPENARSYAERPGVDYDDVLLFVPRLVLTPPRWILAAAFWPLEQLLVFIEAHRVVEHTIDLLYNDDRTAGIFPTIGILSSQGTSFGARAFHNDLFGSGESISIAARAGGIVSQAYDLSFEADRLGDRPLWIEAQMRWERQPSLHFRGIGDFDTTMSAETGLDPFDVGVPSQFSEDRFLGRLRAGTTHGRSDRRIKAGVSLIFNHRRFDAARRLGTGERSVTEVYDTSLIPGFDDGTSLFEVTGDLVLDFRNRRGQPSSGLLAEAFLGGVPRQNQYGYFHWGVESTVFVELFEETRVLVLHGAIEGLEGDRGSIPLASFARLGGPGRLRGYRLDSLRDEKALITSAAYHWPIHQYITGVLFVDAGRVGDDYRDLFDVGTWRVGGGGGLRVGSADTSIFELDFAYGDGFFFYLSTDPFQTFVGRTERL